MSNESDFDSIYDDYESSTDESPLRINIRIEIPKGFTKKDIDILFEKDAFTKDKKKMYVKDS